MKDGGVGKKIVSTETRIVKVGKCLSSRVFNLCFVIWLQETEGQKTNNGIQYRLQLLYANGE